MQTVSLKNLVPCTLLALSLGAALPVRAADGDRIAVRHLAGEQNLVSISTAKRYLLLPVQDDAPEAKIRLIGAGNHYLSEPINVRLARERVDYFVPLDLFDYAQEAGTLTVEVQGLPAGALCWKEMKPDNAFDTQNREAFRPLYHHTPAYGWMNDPNGLFFLDGTYHLYYQHNPYGSTWGNMTWGHSTSTDLVHWQAQPNAILPDAHGTIFSGSAVVDKDNTAGLGAGTVVAFYTSAKPSAWGDSQSQSMAYSTDGGRTFTKYEGNPVLTSTKADFRDPKVFWYAPGKHWVMILAAGQEMEIYSSKNLKEWKYESSFGARQGAHGGVWECPDLVQLPVEGTRETRWVLICNINPGGPFGGNAAQYFVGTFDGRKFTNESPTQTKWMDWGKDHYATVTFSNSPDGRVIALGWMSNWQYQGVLPTLQYRGANTLARDLSLYRAKDGELMLRCAPSPEVEKARTQTQAVPAFRVGDTYEVSILPDGNEGAYELELELENGGAERIALALENGKGERVLMYYDMQRAQLVMDRSESGLISFSPDFPAMTVAPVEDAGSIRLRLFVDRSSIEAFGGGGKFVMTNRVFPSAPYDRLKLEARRGSFRVKSLKVHKIS